MTDLSLEVEIDGAAPVAFLKAHINSIPRDLGYVCKVYKAPNKRTIKQNSSLHKYCGLLAKKLNDAGFDQIMLYKMMKEGKFKIPFTKLSIKFLFRAVGKSMFRIESTGKLSTVEMKETYQAFDARISKLTGVRCEWPSEESMQNESTGRAA